MNIELSTPVNSVREEPLFVKAFGHLGRLAPTPISGRFDLLDKEKLTKTERRLSRIGVGIEGAGIGVAFVNPLLGAAIYAPGRLANLVIQDRVKNRVKAQETKGILRQLAQNPETVNGKLTSDDINDLSKEPAVVRLLGVNAKAFLPGFLSTRGDILEHEGTFVDKVDNIALNILELINLAILPISPLPSLALYGLTRAINLSNEQYLGERVLKRENKLAPPKDRILDSLAVSATALIGAYGVFQGLSIVANNFLSHLPAIDFGFRFQFFPKGTTPSAFPVPTNPPD